MLKVTFLPKKTAPKNIKEVSYLVNQDNNVIAVSVAKPVFIAEHKSQYYDKVAIIEPRIL